MPENEDIDMDGEAWKRKAKENIWNNPEKIALDEYNSIIYAYFEHVLRPIVQTKARLDKTTVALTKSDLECKVENPNFQNLPFNTRRAYQNFLEFIKILELSTDQEVESYKDVLERLFRLGISCYAYHNGMKDIYKKRNPCRDSQYAVVSAIAKAEQERGSQLLEASRKMVDTCLRCPYK